MSSVARLRLLMLLVLLGACVAVRAGQNCDAVILSDQTTYEVRDKDEASYSRFRRVEVRNADGKHYGIIRLSESQFVKLEEFSGAVYDAGGNKVYECGKDDGRERSGYGGYALYSDLRDYRYELTSNKYPYVVEYSYTKKLKSLFFWPEWLPQEYDSVRVATYSLIAPAEFEFHTRANGLMPDHTVSGGKDKVTYRWELEDLEPLVVESCAAPDDQIGLCLKFAPLLFEFGDKTFDGTSWSSLSRGFAELTQKCYRLDDDQKKLIDNSSSTRAAPEVLAFVDGYLKERARYVAIEVGIGGWVPSEAKETIKRGYGDCKDLSTAFTTLLNYVDVEAHAALALTRDQGVVDPELPALNSFNHVIMYAVIANDTIWHDPTCEDCLPGDLPWWDEGINVLSVHAGGGPLLQTPRSTASDNLVIRSARLRALDTPSPQAAIQLTVVGNPEQRLLYLRDHASQQELASYLQRQPFNLGEGFEIDSVRFQDSDGDRLSLVAYGSVRHLVRLIGSQTHLDNGFLPLLGGCEDIDLIDREGPLQFAYPLTYIDTVSFALPTDWDFITPVDTTILNENFGDLTLQIGAADGIFTWARQRTQPRYRIKPDELLGFALHRDQLTGTAKRLIDFDTR